VTLVVDQGSTDASLLRKVADWTNHPAWVAFQARYEPLLRGICRQYGLDADAADEVCQRIWIELAGRMKVFLYDPTSSFRGWLNRLCTSRVVDYLRQQRGADAVSISGQEDRIRDRARGKIREEPEEAMDPLRDVLHCEAERLQAQVKKKVRPASWEAFWLVAVRDMSVEETARMLEMTRTAVYAATARVGRMLREEAERGPGAGRDQGGADHAFD
jgi:RNA polymerase sigma-70 factor (ECF subfamily)